MDWKFESVNGQQLPVMPNGLVPLVSRCWIGGITPGEKFGEKPHEAAKRLAARHAELSGDAKEALEGKFGKQETIDDRAVVTVLRVHDPHDTEPPVSGLHVPATLPDSPIAIARASLNMSPETAAKAVITNPAKVTEVTGGDGVGDGEKPKQVEDKWAEQQRKAKKEKGGQRDARENSTLKQDEEALAREEAQRSGAGNVTLTLTPDAIAAAQAKVGEAGGVTAMPAGGAAAPTAVARASSGDNPASDAGHPPSAAHATPTTAPAEGAHTKNSPPSAKK